MTLERALHYLSLWSAIGCAGFCAYVVLAFRTGIVYSTRKEDGTLKKRIPLSGYLNMMVFLLLIIGFQVGANYFGLFREKFQVSFISLFLLNFGLYCILFLFDTAVIDGLVLAVWRPKFLHLPDALGQESMREHMLKSIPIGFVAGIGLTAVSTMLAYPILFAN